MTIADEDLRAERLLDAQNKAQLLFAEIERSGMIRAGVGERQLSDEIRDLAAAQFGVSRHWHKRIVRAGENTLQPYRQNPPDRVIADDDIVFCDFGPIFEEWEADFGRTFVLGDDPGKRALCDDLPIVFDKGRDYFEAHPDVTGAELFDHVVQLSRDAGWEFGGTIAGHLVGEFPHETIAGDDVESYIAPGSDHPMRRTDRTGRVCHWILEVHLIDPVRQFGGFYEELLDLG
ncbi:aminopeptidase P family protein [Mycolicibacterium moriokaense]|nr:aminopeptidase P family protein [Mycolicibacterium moriokaense]